MLSYNFNKNSVCIFTENVCNFIRAIITLEKMSFDSLLLKHQTKTPLYLFFVVCVQNIISVTSFSLLFPHAKTLNIPH